MCEKAVIDLRLSSACVQEYFIIRSVKLHKTVAEISI